MILMGLRKRRTTASAMGPIFFLMVVTIALTSCASKKEASRNPAPSPATAPLKPSLLQNYLEKISTLFPKKHSPPTATPPQWIGVIRMVNSAENFVLVESSAISLAIPGETYLAVGKGVETASLKMTSLKNPPFLIADILSGSPSPGDKIYLPKSASQPPAPKPTPKPKPSPSPTTPQQTPNPQS